MTTVITSKYRTFNTDSLINDISINDYYLFASSIEDMSVVNSERSATDFLENTLFGKKIDPANIFFMVDDNRWQYGVVYDQYDDTIDLSDKKFYTVVYPTDNITGDYRVYKCLFNNHGSPSYNAPNYDAFADDQIYRMGDGYVWKFMYTITPIEFEKYSALNYVPVIGESAIANTAVIGRSVDHIEVTNYDLNKGYELRSGDIEEVFTEDVVVYSSAGNLSEIPNYYTGQNLYVINPDGTVARLYTIDTYSYNTSTLRATIRLVDKDSFIQENCKFEIFPRIEITGDGSGAVAIPRINSLGTIETVLVLNRGSGYTNAAARIVTPLYGFDPTATNSVDVEAILRPILSPDGGHASNFASELKSKRALVYLNLTETDNITIPSSNQYTKIGIVKNPTFTSNTNPDLFDNRLKLELSSIVLTENEIVTQVSGSTVTMTAQVHSVDGNIAYLCDYHGPYQNYEIDGYSDIPLDTTRPIISSQNRFISINNVTRPTYIQKTGDVYYMTSFSPIVRTPSSNEEYKIILEF